ncbi:MAG TPA: tetratricopeptide repeat protein [Sphingomicrobium sp.]
MKSTFAARAALLLTAVPFLTAAETGGTSGTMSSAPSISAPEYNPAAEYQKGLDALKTHRYADAKKSFMKVYPDAARDPMMNTVLGVALMGLEDYKGAEKYLEKAVKLDAKSIVAHEQLGVTYAKLGQRDKAEAELTTLKQLQSTCGTTCADAAALTQAISSISGALGQPAAMITGPGELLFASSGEADTAYLESVSLIHEHRYADAITSLQKAKSVFGAHPDILTYLGFANRKLGNYDVAEDYYRQALEAAPKHRGATEYYGELLVERHNVKGARAMLARLDNICTFGCAEADELRQWIKAGHSPES